MRRLHNQKLQSHLCVVMIDDVMYRKKKVAGRRDREERGKSVGLGEMAKGSLRRGYNIWRGEEL